MVLFVVHEGGTVQVYELGTQKVRLKAELRIHPEEKKNGSIEVTQLAFSPASRDLAVLYRYRSRPSVQLPYDWTHNGRSFCEMDALELVTFHHCVALSKGSFYTSEQQETRHIDIHIDELPVGLALASKGTACVVLRNVKQQNSTTLMLVGRNKDLMEAYAHGESA